jgi:tyrosyl-tRNA synthetase
MKKAFCEPGNVGFCPPIAVASVFCFDGGSSGTDKLVVKRSSENGGDVAYKSKAEIEADFGSGALHPGDLKAAATATILSILEKLSTGIKTDGDATKAAKALKAFQKKAARKKK